MLSCAICRRAMLPNTVLVTATVTIFESEALDTEHTAHLCHDSLNASMPNYMVHRPFKSQFSSKGSYVEFPRCLQKCSSQASHTAVFTKLIATYYWAKFNKVSRNKRAKASSMPWLQVQNSATTAKNMKVLALYATLLSSTDNNQA